MYEKKFKESTCGSTTKRVLSTTRVSRSSLSVAETKNVTNNVHLSVTESIPLYCIFRRMIRLDRSFYKASCFLKCIHFLLK